MLHDAFTPETAGDYQTSASPQSRFSIESRSFGRHGSNAVNTQASPALDLVTPDNLAQGLLFGPAA
jgi:hypothetical protein